MIRFVTNFSKNLIEMRTFSIKRNNPNYITKLTGRPVFEKAHSYLRHLLAYRRFRHF